MINLKILQTLSGSPVQYILQNVFKSHFSYSRGHCDSLDINFRSDKMSEVTEL